MQFRNHGWNCLHDASLIAVSIECASGETVVRMRLHEESARDARIHVTGLTLLGCPRERPWGPGVSINEVRLFSLEDGRTRLEIEVQCGDLIEIEGETVELNVDA